MTPGITTEYLIVRIIIIVSFLSIGFFGAKLIGNFYFNKLSSEYSKPIEEMKNSYKAQIQVEDDPYQLVKMGSSFTKSNSFDLALTAFTRATELDNNYRDAWVWRGYAELKTNPPAGGPQQALDSLKTAEKLDPINAKTYELLASAYTLTGDSDSAQKAKEKFEYLKKSN